MLSCRAIVQTGSPKLRFGTFATLLRPGTATSRSPHRFVVLMLVLVLVVLLALVPVLVVLLAA